MYGQYETGPWIGYHTKEKAHGVYGWVIYDDNAQCTHTYKYFDNALGMLLLFYGYCSIGYNKIISDDGSTMVHGME